MDRVGYHQILVVTHRAFGTHILKPRDRIDPFWDPMWIDVARVVARYLHQIEYRHYGHQIEDYDLSQVFFTIHIHCVSGCSRIKFDYVIYLYQPAYDPQLYGVARKATECLVSEVSTQKQLGFGGEDQGVPRNR